MRAAGLLALGLVACIPIRTEVETAFHETGRTKSVERHVRGLELAVEAEGAEAVVHVHRAMECRDAMRLTGSYVERTTRSVADPQVPWLVGIGGALSIVAGAVAFALPTPEDPEAARSHLAGGIAGLSIGTALVADAIRVAVVTGTSEVSRPGDHDETPSAWSACDREPASLTLVLQRRAPGVAFRRTVPVVDGAHLDLAALLPTEALRGAAPWSSVEFSAGSAGPTVDVDLAPFARATADAAWSRLTAHPSIDAYETFLRDFPSDPHHDDVVARRAALQRAHAMLALDEERRAAWVAAADDSSRLLALLEGTPGDVWEAEAACRLASRATALATLRTLAETCRTRIAAMPLEVRTLHPDVLARAVHEARDAEVRLATAEEAAREAEARDLARQEELRARDAARRAASERSARDAARRATALAESTITRCRSGARGAGAVRATYEALRDARDGFNGRSLQSTVLRVAVACGCTPSCAGVTLR